MLMNPLEGPWEQVHRELEAHTKELQGRRVRFYVVDEGVGKPPRPKTVGEALGGRTGKFNFGPPNLSTNIREEFIDILEEKQKQDRL